MYLKLPFAYEIEGTLKKRRNRSTWIFRADVIADIEEVSGLTPAMSLDVDNDCRVLFTHGGRFYVRAWHLDIGRIRAKDFEEIVYQTRETIHADWNAIDFPSPFASLIRRTSALDHHETENSLPWREIHQDRRQEREAQAATFYAEAFLIEDGFMLMQVPEPVWRIERVRARRWRIRLEPRPSVSNAAFEFSMREEASAREFVTQVLGGKLAPTPVLICTASAPLSRSSMNELARLIMLLCASNEDRIAVKYLDADERIRLAKSAFDTWDRLTRPSFPETELLRQRWLFEWDKPETQARWQHIIEDDEALAGI